MAKKIEVIVQVSYNTIIEVEVPDDAIDERDIAYYAGVDASEELSDCIDSAGYEWEKSLTEIFTSNGELVGEHYEL